MNDQYALLFSNAMILQNQNGSPLRSSTAYEKLYQKSIQDPKAFWLEHAKCIEWSSFPTVADESNFEDPAKICWFSDGVLNVCYNCVDLHAAKTPHKTAIVFEQDEPGKAEFITYQQLKERVCKCANVLKSLGVKKGDVVTLYLPMIPELIYMMLACARIGAVHSVVFSGFSANALYNRLKQVRSDLIVTVREGHRGGKEVLLKKNVDLALQEGPTAVTKVLIINEKENALSPTHLETVQEFSYDQLLKTSPSDCPCENVAATEPLFILYTSGSTGKPKGILHSSGGYIVYAALTHQFVFDLQPDDVYFCTADIGWITGHSYGVYGPLSNGSTLVLFQGIPTYPNSYRLWDIIDTYKVSLFYTAPTALRSLSRLDKGGIDRASLQSLRVLASVGEPIDPTTWNWFYEKVGRRRCPIMDTWWQTESGGVLVCPLLESVGQKAGCAAKPFFGIEPRIMSEQGVVLNPETKGDLCIQRSWPGQTIGVLGDSDYFQKSYFTLYPKFYMSGDGAKVDAGNDIWILGRIDDVLNVSGHRLNSAELEQAVMSHGMVSDVCVVGFPHEIKGQGIFVFAVPHSHIDKTDDELVSEIRTCVRTAIGPIATPDRVLLVHDLPKTRSGKIVRRLLRKMAANDSLEHEDLTVLTNPECLEIIEQTYKKAIEDGI